MDALIVPHRIWQQLTGHVIRELPNECVGMLVGLPDGRVEAAYEIANALAQPRRFVSEPASLFAAEKRRRSEGWHLLGFYHSHPEGLPVPSQVDTDPEVNYWLDGSVVTLILAVQPARRPVQSNRPAQKLSDCLEAMVEGYRIVARAYRLYPYRWEPVALRSAA